MRIGLQTWGSEGDISPFAALAEGLTRAGHKVVLAISDVGEGDHQALAERHGYELLNVAHPGDEDFPDDIEDMWPKLLMVRNPIRRGELILKYSFDPYVSGMHSAAIELCRRCDLVIGHFMVYPLGIVAEACGVPFVTIHTGHNYLPTLEWGTSELPKLGRWSYRLGWDLVRLLVNRRFLSRVNRLRAHMGLSLDIDVMKQTWLSPWLTLVAVSPSMIKSPGDWHPNTHICGFVNSTSNSVGNVMPEGLAEFIAADHAAPVYFTFGSAAPQEHEGLRKVVAIWREAIERLGRRAVFQLPVSDLDQFDCGPLVFKVKRAPYERVFPACALVVHHGGSGTTHATLLAGRPSVVVPHMADQFVWAFELRRLGVAGPMLKRTKMTSRKLAKAIADVISQPGLTKRAEALRASMVRENGVREAISRIEALLTRSVLRQQ